MSLEAWRYMDDLDNEARLLGYWITHISTPRGSGFLLYRFDEPRVLGEWFSAEKEEDLHARLTEIADLPRWRLPIGDNPMVEHHKYGVVVTDDIGRRFDAPAYRGDEYLYIHSEGRPPIGNWEPM